MTQTSRGAVRALALTVAGALVASLLPLAQPAAEAVAPAAGIQQAPRLPATAGVRSIPAAGTGRSVPAGATPGTGSYVVYGPVGGAPALTTITLPAAAGTPLMGDWDGDGLMTPGRYDNGSWFGSDGAVGTAGWVALGSLGTSGDTPVVGRIDKDRQSDLGVFRDGVWTWQLSKGGTRTDAFGQAGDIPIVGDWDGDGTDDIGVVRAGSWIMRLTDVSKAPKMGKGVVVDYVKDAKAAVLTFGFGNPGETPVVGDWNGDGIDTPGVVRGSTWVLSAKGPRGLKKVTEVSVPLAAGQVPLVGNQAGASGSCPTTTPAAQRKAFKLLSRAQAPKRTKGMAKLAGMAETKATVEDGLRFVMTNDLTKRLKTLPSRPYYDALRIAATQEESIRRQANTAQAAAILTQTSDYQRKNNISRAQLINYAKWHVRSIACAHASVSPGGWGNSFQSALWATSAGMAGWLLWGELAPQERAYVAAMVAAEADHSVARGPFYFQNRAGKALTAGDSRADEVSWDLMAPALAIVMLPRDPRVPQWRASLASLAIASFSRPSDLKSNEIVNGVNISKALPGTNANEDGTITNHGKVNPDYTQNVEHLWQAASLLRLGGQPVPEALFLNADIVYRALAVVKFESPPYAAPGGTVYQPLGQIYYPMGTGWGTRRPATFVGVDGFAYVYAAKDANAAEFLAAHARDTRALQLRWTDGHIYASGAGEETYKLGKEEYALQQMALAWWATSVKSSTGMKVDKSKIKGIDLNPRVPIDQ